MEPNKEQRIKRSSQWEPGIKTCIKLHEGLKTEVIFLPCMSQGKLGYAPETKSPLKQKFQTTRRVLAHAANMLSGR